MVGDLGGPHAFIWDSVNGIQDLNNLIPAGSGWILNHAYGINSSGQIIGQGTINGQLHSFLLTPVAATLASLTIGPAGVVAGAGVSATGTVTLSQAATADVTVSLSSSDPSATVPSTVTVPAGQMSQTFSIAITQTPVQQDISLTITGTYNGAAEGAVLTVQAPWPTFITPASYSGPGLNNANITGTVMLNGPAPAGGMNVSLASSNPAVVAVPSQVVVPAGQVSVTFPITTYAVAVATSVTVTAQDSWDSEPPLPLASATLSLRPPDITVFSLNPSSVYGGNSSTAFVMLDGPTPAGVNNVITINGGSPVVTDASPFQNLPSGQQSFTFLLHTNTVPNDTVFAMTANYAISASPGWNGGTLAANLTVKTAQLLALAFSPTVVTQGGVTKLTVKLTSAAPAGGAPVALSTSDKKVVPVPSSVTVPAGSSSVTLSITTGKSKTSPVTVTVMGGYLSGTKSATVTVN